MIDTIFNHLSIIPIKNNYILYRSAVIELCDIYYMIWNTLIIIKFVLTKHTLCFVLFRFK